MPSNNDIFDGIDTSWTRLKGGAPIGKILAKVQENFNFQNPGASVSQLANAYALIDKLPDSHWKQIKEKEIKDIIAACSGLYLEGVTNTPMATIGETVGLRIEAINRSDAQITLNGIIGVDGKEIKIETPLTNNKKYTHEPSFTVDDSFTKTNAYWLNETGSLGMYKVTDRRLIGKPETPKENTLRYELTVAGVPITVEKPVVYKFNDRVKGEVYQYFEIVPEASVALEEKVEIFASTDSKEITVKVTAHKQNLSGTVALELAKNWLQRNGQLV